MRILRLFLAYAFARIVIGFHTERIIVSRIYGWVSSTSPSTTAEHAISKKAEMYIKVKRLKQMIADGKGYQEFVDEKKRYEKPEAEDEPVLSEDGNVTSDSSSAAAVEVKRKLLSLGLGKSDPVEVMKKVLKYQQDKIDQQQPPLDKNLIESAIIVPIGNDIDCIDVEIQAPDFKEISLQEAENNEEYSIKVAFLPDCGIDDSKRYFYRELNSLFQKISSPLPETKDDNSSTFYPAAYEHDQELLSKQRLESIDPIVSNKVDLSKTNLEGDSPQPVSSANISSSSSSSSYLKKISSTFSIFTSTMSILPMPNIYDLNTKRYEQKWMNYMRTLDLNSYDIVLAHGSSSEALLRYLESEKVKKCILLDCSDTYTAGERHGRSYRYSLIIDNCKEISILSTDEKYVDETAKLSTMLNIKGIDTFYHPVAKMKYIESTVHVPGDNRSVSQRILTAINSILHE